MPGEFEQIDWVRRRVGSHPRVPLGIGDDAALVRLSSDPGTLVTVDMLMEGTDFTFPPATPRLAGRKALAVNLSDIAAMAGRPVACVVSVALPRGRGIEFARELHLGIEELAREFDVAIAGGDTNSWDGPLVVSATVFGETVPPGPIRRSGAQPGDWIFVTGSCGGSIHGRHLTFTPRVREALALHSAVSLHAMIDVSDGLAADLHHILDESRVGAVVEAAAIPIHSDVRDNGTTPLEHALGDGEDFELIFTVSPEDGAKLFADDSLKSGLTRIGTIAQVGVRELHGADGSVSPLLRRGWEHTL
jgi:thiamine-monophosphate kinase